MRGLMMDYNLNIPAIIRHAQNVHPDQTIVSFPSDGTRHSYTYGDAFRRARRLANALDRLDCADGARLGTLAWNDHRHLELHYAIPGSRRVCHTINPRLGIDQIRYIIQDAGDEVLFIDPQFIGLVEGILADLPRVRHFIALCAADDLPASTLPGLRSYEALLAAESDHYDWPDMAETDACGLCYTSGTTGNPKGVLSSHRGMVLQCMAQNMADAIGLRAVDVVMPMVPMFHVNAWATPYSAVMAGAALVLPGPGVGDGARMAAMMAAEKVTLSLGVPTHWLGIVGHLEETGGAIPTLTRAVCGGAACPLSLIERMARLGTVLENGWGMTELCPMGSYNRHQRWYADLDATAAAAQVQKSGRALFGVEMRIVDADGRPLPRDGVGVGALQVRGPWVRGAYYGLDDGPAEPWFDTGDLATLDRHGYMQITDRAKDMIKSGGEWISSVELENIAVDHPAVQEAAVIGVTHPRWSERPLLVVVPAAGAVPPTHQDLISHLNGKVPKWWLPDASVVVSDLPRTATGKISKKALRDIFAAYDW